MADQLPTAEEMTAAKYLGATGLVTPSELVTIAKIRRSKETFEAGKKDLVNVFGITRQDGTAAEVLFCKTNVYACRVLLGDDTSKWLGKRLSLIIDQDLFQGDTVECIRISGSPDAAFDRMGHYVTAFDDPSGRPRKLIKRLKGLVATLKRTDPRQDLAFRIAAMRKTLNDDGFGDELILAVVEKQAFEDLAAEDLTRISEWYSKRKADG